MLKNRIRRWGVVGPVLGGDNTIPATGRQAKTGEAVVAQAHGKYYEAAGRGLIYTASDQGAGIAVASLTAAGTTQVMSLFNPVNSVRRLSLLRLRIAYFSGTLGAGALYHASNAPAQFNIAPGGTTAVSTCTDIGNQSALGAVGIAKCAPTITTAVPAASIGGPVCSLGAALASTVLGINNIIEDIDGEIVVEPGYYYVLIGVTAAGSTPKISVGLSWEELPIVASQG